MVELKRICRLLVWTGLFLLQSANLSAAPQRTWPVSIDIPAWQLYDVRTTLKLTISDGGAIVGHSPNSAPRILGVWRYLLARIWGVPLQRGAWLHLKAMRQPDGRIVGVLSSAFTAPLSLDCASLDTSLPCSLRRQGRTFGSLHVHSRAATQRGQAALAREIRRTLEQAHYRPDRLRSQAWTSAFKAMDALFARANDDLDVLAAWRQLARRLPDSHVTLLRSAADDTPESLASMAANVEKHIQLNWNQRLPVLKISSFALDTTLAAERLQKLIGELGARDARELIVDLRGNSGGNLSAMLLAEHLFDAPRLAGCFVTRRWWSENTQAPSEARAARLPTFERADQAEFERALAENSAVCVRVVPRALQFSGVVHVLIDGQSSSATEPLAYLLKASGRARLVGTRTAGAMLSSARLPLVDGWQLSVPTADYFAIDGQRLEGVGVSPQLMVPAEKALDYVLR